MRLTLHTDYSLRVLMFAALKGDGLSTIGEIAEHFEISRTHLMKVVNDLGRAGYLETVRGKKGGFRLAKKPRAVKIGAVVRDLEDELGVVGCMQQANYCAIEGACVLRRALGEATAAFLAVLDRYTLDDLVRPRKSLVRLLDLGGLPQVF
ncbi:MAG TPA: Rrf2 family transcriptional regulator [Stellaceae bacterium]|nr:Rrf2 family transcriptional regulator [Stellaceae bacterium]